MKKEEILIFDIDKYLGLCFNYNNNPIFDMNNLEKLKKLVSEYSTKDIENDPFEFVEKFLSFSGNHQPLKKEKQYQLKIHINFELTFRKTSLECLLETTPFPRLKVLENVLNELVINDFKEFEDIASIVGKGEIVQDIDKLAQYIGLIRFVQYLDQEINKEKENESPELEKPIKWLGQPSHLGYIMGQLANLGYIEAPTHMTGEINYNEFARQLSKVFNINSIGNLAKELNPEKNSMGYKNKDKISIPHIKEISK